MTFDKSIHIDADTATVWTLLGPEFGNLPQWFPGVTACRIIEGDPRRPDVGMVRECDLPPGGKLDRIVERITHFQPMKRLAYQIVNAPRPIERWHNDYVIESDAGGTRLTYRTDLEMAGGPLGPTLAKLVWKAQVGRIVDDILQAAKRESESRTAQLRATPA